MQHDIEIPQRFGIRQPIGDSVGPGGIMRALRSVPVLLDIARDVEAVAPDAWLVNVTNPLTALCRSVTRETNVKTVGLCNEWVGCSWILSLLFDCGMDDIDPILGGVNHYPLATSLRVKGDDDGFVRLHALLGDPERAATEPIWMDPPERAGWVKVSPAEYWTKLDVIENNRVPLRAVPPLRCARRFGRSPLGGVHARSFVHPGNDYGSDWRVHHYGMPGHRRDADEDVEFYEEMRDAPDVTRMPSGELVAQLLDGMVTGRRPEPPGEPAERGQRHEPRRRRGRRDHGRRRRHGRPRARQDDGAGDHGRVPAAHQRRAGVDGRGGGRRRPRARARGDARRPDRRAAPVREDRRR